MPILRIDGIEGGSEAELKGLLNAIHRATLAFGTGPYIGTVNVMNTTCRWLVFLIVTVAICKIAPGQSAPPSPDRTWHFPVEHEVREEAKALRVSRLAIDATKSYSLAELVDFAERNNPETRVTCGGAKARGAAFYIPQSEVYPSLAAVALSQVYRQDVWSGSSFW